MFDLPVYLVPLSIISKAFCPSWAVGRTSAKKVSFAASKKIGYAYAVTSNIVFSAL